MSQPKMHIDLNQHFEHVEDATAALVNVFGTGTDIDDAVTAFQHMVGGNRLSFSTDFIPKGWYIPSAEWLLNWLRANDFVMMTHHWIKMDDKNRPMYRVTVSCGHRNDLNIRYVGEHKLGCDLLNHIRDNCVYDEKFDTDDYLELTGYDQFGNLRSTRRELTKGQILHPAFYPCLEGGFDALLTQFMESNESLLILAGVPGTGKTTGIRIAAMEHGLMPIVASSAEVILQPTFINSAFDIYDRMARECRSGDGRKPVMTDNWFWDNSNPECGVFGTTAPETSGEFNITVADGTLSFMRRKPVVNKIPLLVIEDAEHLLGKREEGNALMQNLLNKTDGLSKDYPPKVILTTNLRTLDGIDPALLRPGRCFGFYPLPELSAAEAVAARKAAGLPDFPKPPAHSMSLAEALRPPRMAIFRDSASGRVSMH